MNRDFEFKQILRAYRAGIINETDFEREMKNLENGWANGNGHGGFKAFGRSYASEREAVMSFLETVSAAETNGGEAIRKWLDVCTTDCIRGGLQMVAEREAYHGRAFERRLKELGGTMPNRVTDDLRKNLAYLGDMSISDLQKLQRGAKRFPNPEETIRPPVRICGAVEGRSADQRDGQAVRAGRAVHAQMAKRTLRSLDRDAVGCPSIGG